MVVKCKDMQPIAQRNATTATDMLVQRVCFANLGGKYREDEINQTGVRQDNAHWHAVDMRDPCKDKLDFTWLSR